MKRIWRIDQAGRAEQCIAEKEGTMAGPQKINEQSCQLVQAYAKFVAQRLDETRMEEDRVARLNACSRPFKRPKPRPQRETPAWS